jgi:hypothetical protein
MPKQRPLVKRHIVAQPLDPSYRLIPLTKGQNAIVDTADFLWLSQWNWFAQWDVLKKSFYAKRRDTNGKIISMHSFILGCARGMVGDHINGVILDNRRVNLREATVAENSRNRSRQKRNKSGYTGVRFEYKSWRARIRHGAILHSLGMFDTPEAAARAYDEAAKKLFKDFAHLNFS